MSQPPYGVPPQQGQPQGYPPQPPPVYGQPGPAAAPPPYLGGAPAPGPHGAPPAYGGFGGPALPPPPPSKPRHVGLIVGLITTFLLLGFVLLVAIISIAN